MTLEELATLLGEDPAELHRWRDLGLLGSDDDFAIEGQERARLVQFAARRGIPPDEVARICAAHGDMLGPFARWGPSEGRGAVCTRAEAGERTGLDPNLVDEVMAAAGLWDQTHAYEE